MRYLTTREAEAALAALSSRSRSRRPSRLWSFTVSFRSVTVTVYPALSLFLAFSGVTL